MDCRKNTDLKKLTWGGGGGETIDQLIQAREASTFTGFRIPSGKIGFGTSLFLESAQSYI